jgi:hypothetical protein
MISKPPTIRETSEAALYDAVRAGRITNAERLHVLSL